MVLLDPVNSNIFLTDSAKPENLLPHVPPLGKVDGARKFSTMNILSPGFSLSLVPGSGSVLPGPSVINIGKLSLLLPQLANQCIKLLECPVSKFPTLLWRKLELKALAIAHIL